MLSRDSIVFEYDTLAHAHTVSQDTVKDALVVLVNEFITELGIFRLDKVIVKETNFFETELGLANYKNFTIVLANQIAYRLTDKGNRFYRSALAVLKHEMYHFLDYQNLLLNRVRKHITQFNDEILMDYKYWTEFFASFSTFEVCEDEDLYASFKSVFEKSYSSSEDKKYYTCRLFGYYLHDNHSKLCDELVAKYLSNDAIEEITINFKSVLQSYPNFSTEQLRNIGLAISKVIVKQDEIATYTPISRDDFWKQLRERSKDNM